MVAEPSAELVAESPVAPSLWSSAELFEDMNAWLNRRADQRQLTQPPFQHSSSTGRREKLEYTDSDSVRFEHLLQS